MNHPVLHVQTDKATSPAYNSNDIMVHVERIIESRVFARSKRLSRFLRFIVERAIAEDGANLKEYVLGVEVFDRGVGFDPHIDPIVRVEARRLREKLRVFYRAAGPNETLRIALPKGSYKPVFRTRSLRSKRAPASGVLVVLDSSPTTLQMFVDQIANRHQRIRGYFAPEMSTEAWRFEISIMPIRDTAAACTGLTLLLKDAHAPTDDTGDSRTYTAGQ